MVISEGVVLSSQHNTVIAFLQEQVHELQMELGDAIEHIGMLHEQPMPPAVLV